MSIALLAIVLTLGGGAGLHLFERVLSGRQRGHSVALEAFDEPLPSWQVADIRAVELNKMTMENRNDFDASLLPYTDSQLKEYKARGGTAYRSLRTAPVDDSLHAQYFQNILQIANTNKDITSIQNAFSKVQFANDYNPVVVTPNEQRQIRKVKSSIGPVLRDARNNITATGVFDPQSYYTVWTCVHHPDIQMKTNDDHDLEFISGLFTCPDCEEEKANPEAKWRRLGIKPIKGANVAGDYEHYDKSPEPMPKEIKEYLKQYKDEDIPTEALEWEQAEGLDSLGRTIRKDREKYL